MLQSVISANRIAGNLFMAAALTLTMLTAPGSFAQSPVPTFEAATIKPATGCMGPGRGGPMGPGRLTMGCTTLRDLIRIAYGAFAGGPAPDPRWLQIIGGPKWLESDQYNIEAKATGTPGLLEMMGPMMQALLEDRFKLKLHREPKDMPVYVLTVAKSSSKLQPEKDGSCTPRDLKNFPPAPPVPGQTPPCGRTLYGTNGQDPTIEISGMSVAEFAGQILAQRVDRPLIDKTGLTGLFDFHLQYARDSAQDSAAPSIFTALQEQLGLKLSAETGPVNVLVIDHVEKPSEN
jgi:uncharacterized protein (TIGR03435 family)